MLVDIANDDDHLQAIFELDAATNDRLLAAQQLLPGIGLEELVFGVPNATIVNAAFCHPHPLGSRFNGPDRGAWYAAFDVETSMAEVVFHKTVQLSEVHRFEDSVTYDDYLADFSATFHDLRAPGDGARSAQVEGTPRRAAAARAWSDVLDPSSYIESQGLAAQLLAAASLGVVYPSVRKPGGTCVACFRPALVTNVRRDRQYRITWSGTPAPEITSA